MTVRVAIRSTVHRVEDMTRWCDMKGFPYRYVTGEKQPNLMKLSKLFGAVHPHYFEFTEPHHATMFRMKWA